MKSFKFRAWNSSKNKWEYFTPENLLAYWDEFNEHVMNGDEFYPCTGLLARNGREIYEGDIVNTFSGLKTVQYSDDIACFECVSPMGSRTLHGYVNEPKSGAEIVGSIYEPPKEGK